jgi:hemoglobin-like flavoprotein
VVEEEIRQYEVVAQKLVEACQAVVEVLGFQMTVEVEACWGSHEYQLVGWKTKQVEAC